MLEYLNQTVIPSIFPVPAHILTSGLRNYMVEWDTATVRIKRLYITMDMNVMIVQYQKEAGFNDGQVQRIQGKI